MLPVAPSHSPFSRFTPRPSRIIAAALSLALLLLMFWMLIWMGFIDFDTPKPVKISKLVTIDVGGQSEQHMQKAAATQKQRATVKPQPQKTVVTPTVQVTTPTPPTFIHLSKQDFAASDISKFSHQKADGDTGNSAGTYGPGDGPGGAHLFNAAWYREPSDAEMSPYLKQGAPDGSWATIACRTADHFHVEDCRELDESPPGSGLARSLRLASWQFLVRPPRVNGDSQMGVWVRIRFDFTARGHRGE